MSKANEDILADRFGRVHNYLRISLTEKCNLRCFYCMPSDRRQFSPQGDVMTAEEITEVASKFVAFGVKKIRLTGGEPLVRKDFADIIGSLAKMPVQLALTTNGILLDKYLAEIKKAGIKKINVSLDTLDQNRFIKITGRDYFKDVFNNISLLYASDIVPGINTVIVRGVNEDEVTDFVELTKEKTFSVRFIEYMPFNNNRWNKALVVSAQEILDIIAAKFGKENILECDGTINGTAKQYKVKGFAGSFGLISTITNPFCEGCNRIRLTADGKMKNCLFSKSETDLLSVLRSGGNIENSIRQTILRKEKMLGGIADFNEDDVMERVAKNRSMVLIGG